MLALWAVAVAVFLVNLPFGFWRAGVRRFTLPWFVAIHAPVPLAVGLRVLAGVGWQPSSLPAMVGAFLLGQFLGGRLRRYGNRSR